ncbi:MAG TPA: glycosyltransferase family 2 protein [Bacteroidales bacterium]|nr:glycosyltransferase family 2 protein [Bacteroidales bacterium]
MELTILMPCLNESETLAICIQKARSFLQRNGIDGEVLIADNGSTDGSKEIAVSEGARVVDVSDKGYGNALIGGINAAKGKYIIMGDADDSYDFVNMEPFVEKLREGYDLVMGNRFKGGIAEGAMPFLHRYLGNPVLSFIGRLFFNIKTGDFHCGLRGFNADRIKMLKLHTPGMEFASEMVVKSSLFKYKMAEVPTTLKKDGRSHPPHLHTWRDGWRHLVFLLMYSPKWLFLIPGLIILILSIIGFGVLSVKMLYLKNIGIDIHTLTYLGFAIILSYQIILFALLSKFYAVNQGLIPVRHQFMKVFKFFTLEKGLVTGLILFFAGLVFSIILFKYWADKDFGNITDFSHTFRLLIPSVILMALGIQTIFSSFILRIIGIIQHVVFLDDEKIQNNTTKK